MKTKDQKPSGTQQPATCRACGGKGFVNKPQPGKGSSNVRCIHCGGTGKSSGYGTK